MIRSVIHLIQQEITSLRQMNLQIQGDVEELKQYGRRLSLRIDGVSAKKKERSHDVYDHFIRMFKEAGAGDVDGYIARGYRVGKNYFDKKSLKNVRVLLLSLQHSVIAQ